MQFQQFMGKGKELFVFALAILCLHFDSLAQVNTVEFGKNRVQYRKFKWQYYQTQNFNTYFYENGHVPKYLLNTHCHLDHVFGNKFVYDTWGLELYTHELEKPVLEYAPTSGRSWGIPFENYSGPLHWLLAGDEVVLGTDRLTVLFTPGHSPGHITFYSAADEFVLSGDVLFQGSIGRTDLPGGNFNTLISSIREQLFVLPDNTKVYSGHGDSTFIGIEKRNNPFLKEG